MQGRDTLQYPRPPKLRPGMDWEPNFQKFLGLYPTDTPILVSLHPDMWTVTVLGSCNWCRHMTLGTRARAKGQRRRNRQQLDPGLGQLSLLTSI